MLGHDTRSQGKNWIVGKNVHSTGTAPSKQLAGPLECHPTKLNEKNSGREEEKKMVREKRNPLTSRRI